MTQQERINEYNAEDKKFFDAAFKGIPVPADIRRLSERICRSYGIRGICDPAYIANIIAVELGRGDGLSHFN